MLEQQILEEEEAVAAVLAVELEAVLAVQA